MFTALQLYHFYFVNPIALRIETKAFDYAMPLAKTHTWCTVAVVAGAYMVDDTCYVATG